MSHRAHLFSLRICHALRESLAEGYNRHKLVKDLLAGITVGIIAIPLAMALAIASGVPPQYGLYTAIIAGFVIALTGGSRFSIIKYSQHHRRSFTLAVYGKQAEE